MGKYFVTVLFLIGSSPIFATADVRSEEEMRAELPGVWESVYLLAAARSYVIIDNNLLLYSCVAVQLEPFICYVNQPAAKLSHRPTLIGPGWITQEGSGIYYQLRDKTDGREFVGYRFSKPWVGYIRYKDLNASQILPFPAGIRLPKLAGLVVCEPDIESPAQIRCLNPHRAGAYLKQSQ